MRKPKYKIGQKVQVQIFNIITTGTVEQAQERITYFKDGSTASNTKYWVDIPHTKHMMEPWEGDLALAQTLPLGEMK